MAFLDTHETEQPRERAPTEVLIMIVAVLVGVGAGAIMYVASVQSPSFANLIASLGLPVNAQTAPPAIPRAEADGIVVIDDTDPPLLPAGSLPTADDETPPASDEPVPVSAPAPVKTAPPPPPATIPSSQKNGSAKKLNDGGAVKVNTTFDPYN